MESIAVAKPNMMVTRQESLSPFGLLTELFTEEIARRNTQSTGFYRPMTLAYLEEAETEALTAPPEIHIDLNIELLMNRLLKEAREKQQKEVKPKTAAERILERVVVREKEIRTASAETRRVVIENGGQRFTAIAPVKIEAQNGYSAPGTKSSAAAERAVPPNAEANSPRVTERPRGTGKSAQPISPVRPAKTVFVGLRPAQKSSDRTLALASVMMSVPSAGGWTPQQRELHPGYPTRAVKETSKGTAVGSILLPDVLRRRREEAVARSETGMSAVSSPDSAGALDEALAWTVENTEQSSDTERMLRQVRRAVENTLRRNAARSSFSTAESVPSDAAAVAGHTQTNGPRQDSRESLSRAHTHVRDTLEERTAFTGEEKPALTPAPQTSEARSARSSPERLLRGDFSDEKAAAPSNVPEAVEKSAGTVVPGKPEIRNETELNTPQNAVFEDITLPPMDFTAATEPAETSEIPQESDRLPLPAFPAVSLPEASVSSADLAEMIFREPEGESAPEAAEQIPAPRSEGLLLPNREKQERPTQSEEPSRQEAVRTGFEPRSAERAETSSAFAIPVQAGTAHTSPAETAYLETVVETSGSPLERAANPRTPGTEKQQIVSPAADRQTKRNAEQPLQMGRKEIPAGAASENADQAKTPVEETVLPPAILVAAASDYPAPAGLALREETKDISTENKTSSKESSQPAAPSHAVLSFVTTPKPESPLETVSTERVEGAPLPGVVFIGADANLEASVPAAVPADTEMPGPGSSELIYREETEETPAQYSNPLSVEASAPAVEAFEPQSESPSASKAAARTGTEDIKSRHGQPIQASAIPAEGVPEQPSSTELIHLETAGDTAGRPSDAFVLPPKQRMDDKHRTAKSESNMPGASEQSAGPSAQAVVPVHDASPFVSEPVSTELPEPKAAEAEETNLPSGIPSAEAAQEPPRSEMVFREDRNGIEPFPSDNVSNIRPAVPAHAEPAKLPQTSVYYRDEAKDAAQRLTETDVTAKAPDAAVSSPAPKETVPKPVGSTEPINHEKTVGPEPRHTEHESFPGLAQASISSAIPVIDTVDQAELPELVYPEAEVETVAQPAERAEESALPAPPLAPAIPTEYVTEHSAPSELIYREADRAEDGRPAERAEDTAQPEPTQAPAIPAEPEPKTAAPSELVYREADRAASGQPAERMEESTRPKPLLASAIPAEPEPETADPSELVFREEDEAASGQPAERVDDTALPAPSLASAIPAEPVTEPSVPPELVYREGTAEGASQASAKNAGRTGQDGKALQRRQTAPLPQTGIRHFSQSRPEDAQQPPLTAGHIARDIRVAGERASEPQTAAAMLRNRAKAQTNHTTAGEPEDPRPVQAAVPAPETDLMAEAPELFFTAAPYGTEPAAEQPQTKAEQPPRPDKQESLPSWAKELLEKSGVADTTMQTAAFHGNASGSANARQINWTSPVTFNPQQNNSSGPAELSFKERGETEESPVRQSISDAEIQRTADKVYRIIEERLRRELRRSGR